MLTLSSTGGISGGMFRTAYSAAKFGAEGWMESLAPEIAPFGIRNILVEPGSLRTELLAPDSYARPSIDDYAECRATVVAWSVDGKQGGDSTSSPAPLCSPGPNEPPARVPVGADAV